MILRTVWNGMMTLSHLDEALQIGHWMRNSEACSAASLADATFHCVPQPWTELLATPLLFGTPSPMDSGPPWAVHPSASESHLQTQLCLHRPSSRPLEGLSAQSPFVCFMGVVNHSTHHAAEGKPDLLDLPLGSFRVRFPQWMIFSLQLFSFSLF